MLLYGRNQYNIVKRLHSKINVELNFKKKINKNKREKIADLKLLFKKLHWLEQYIVQYKGEGLRKEGDVVCSSTIREIE